MNKFFSKTVNKVTLFSVILAVILAAALVITALLGVNYAATTDDANTLTVTGGFFQDSDIEELEQVCEDIFESPEINVEVTHKKNGGRSGADSEIVYFFDVDEDLTAAKDALKAKLAELAADENNSVFYGTIVNVNTGKAVMLAEIAWSYVFRAVGAVGLFAVLAFLYVSLRYRLNMGILTAICILLSAVITTAIVLATRMPITYSTFYAIAVSALLAAVFVLFFFNKVRANAKADKETPAEELVVSSIACKSILGTTIALGVALILVGAIATASTRWFALTALVGLLVAAFIGLLYAPAAYLPMKKAEDKKTAETPKSGYVGAKKTKEESAE